MIFSIVARAAARVRFASPGAGFPAFDKVRAGTSLHDEKAAALAQVLAAMVLRPDAAGRDPIVTRVLCLRGLSGSNRNTAARGIYIPGTPEERKIGKPASYGCIRMRSRDVIALFDAVPVGTRVTITDAPPLLAATRRAEGQGDDWYR